MPNGVLKDLTQRMQTKFLQIFCNINHQVGLLPELPYFDFGTVFEKVLEINGIPSYDAHLYDTVFCNYNPAGDNCILNCIFLPGFHVVHSHLFMRFLFFMVHTRVYAWASPSRLRLNWEWIF